MSHYEAVMVRVFQDVYKPGFPRLQFEREDLVKACSTLKIERIKNIGDIPYSFRFRKDLPDYIQKTAPEGSEWIITGNGIAKYEFRLASPGKIEPTNNRVKIIIPDATPKIVKLYAPGTDEQSLLTRIRYNRLVDMFLGLTCYSIQNHLRTTVESIGQIEVDEIYLGINKRGAHFSIPCQAKSPGDKFGIVQVMQDLLLCQKKYPQTICRPIAVQFLGESDVAILELSVQEINDILKLSVVDEKHYSLVQKSLIDFKVISDRKAYEL
ncbi:MAG: endonuclease [Magnetococcales bacterium]|nr:endonuclease [Magnetococcales bacterium]